MGREAEARREGEHAVALRPVSEDALDGVLYRLNLAPILMKAGGTDVAVDQLAYLLSVPAPISVPALRVDPDFAPLRGDPRFERLVNQP